MPYSQQQHRALTIPEMVRLICEHLEVLSEPHHEGSRNRRNLEDLAALARTCRDFENPALDILWRVQNTLANALKCLPSNLWEETLVPNDGSYCLRLTSAAQGAEWDRPLAHARRVRRLILDEWSSPYAFPDRDLLEIISSSLPQEYLFPNLRNIRLEPHDDAELSFIPLFAGPQLTDITLSVDMTFSEQALFVSKASARQSLELSGKRTTSIADDRVVISCRRIHYDIEKIEPGKRTPFYDLLESSCFYYGRAIFDVTRTLMHYVINSPRRRIVPGRHQIWDLRVQAVSRESAAIMVFHIRPRRRSCTHPDGVKENSEKWPAPAERPVLAKRHRASEEEGAWGKHSPRAQPQRDVTRDQSSRRRFCLPRREVKLLDFAMCRVTARLLPWSDGRVTANYGAPGRTGVEFGSTMSKLAAAASARGRRHRRNVVIKARRREGSVAEGEILAGTPALRGGRKVVGGNMIGEVEKQRRLGSFERALSAVSRACDQFKWTMHHRAQPVAKIVNREAKHYVEAKHRLLPGSQASNGPQFCERIVSHEKWLIAKGIAQKGSVEPVADNFVFAIFWPLLLDIIRRRHGVSGTQFLLHTRELGVFKVVEHEYKHPRGWIATNGGPQVAPTYLYRSMKRSPTTLCNLGPGIANSLGRFASRLTTVSLEATKMVEREQAKEWMGRKGRIRKWINKYNEFGGICLKYE
ncbi:hypothetical protein B0H14DRAFT_3573738 [Mycena olivaceomarginata]|nr:hypothetical protein B0H14DRAFT_3573738 [Mycena olivaceomarginata]